MDELKKLSLCLRSTP